MQKKRILVFLLISFIVCFLFVFLSYQSKGKAKIEQSNKDKVSQVDDKKNPKSSDSVEENGNFSTTTEKSKTTDSKPQSNLDIEKAMTAFVSQRLNKDDVDSREKYLKEVLSPTTFSGQQIELDSINVKKMITSYEEKNEFNSSTKSILADKEVTSVTSYKNISDSEEYYVEVKYTQTSPVMPNEKLSMIEKLKIKVSDNQITDITILSIETLKTEGGGS